MRTCRLFNMSWVLLWPALFAPGQTSPEAAKNDERLDKRINIEPMQNLPTERVIARVLAAAGLPGGIVEVNTCLDQRQGASPLGRSLNAGGLTVRQALDLIVADDSRYKWTFNGTGVNFIPAGGTPGIMNTRLAHFETAQNSTNIDFEAGLLRAPEVKEFFVRHGYEEEDRLRSIVGPGSVPVKRSLSLDNATVLDILNQAAQSYQVPAVWHYTERIGNCKQTYYLDWPVL